MLSESDEPTNMVMLPNGGLLLMSLTPYKHQDIVTKPTIKSIVKKVNRQDELPAETNNFEYPQEWKDKLPVFPFVPEKKDASEIVDDQETTSEDNLPVFPYKPYVYKSNSKSSTTTISSTSTTTSTTSTTTTTLRTTVSKILLKSSTTIPVFNNQIEMHERKKISEKFYSKAKTENFIPFDSETKTSKKNLTDLYQRLKEHYLHSNRQSQTSTSNPVKKYRFSDEGVSGFDNVNVVVPG